MCLFIVLTIHFTSQSVQAQPQKQLKIKTISQKLFEDELSDSARVKLLQDLAKLQQFDAPKALKHLKYALNLSKKNQFLLASAQSYVALGNLKLACRNFNEAYDYFQKGRKVAQKCLFHKEQIDCLIGQGWILIERNQQHEALKTYQKALKIAEITKNEYKTGFVLAKIGEFHRLQKNYDHAFEYFDKALNMAKKYALPKLEFEALSLKSTAYVDLKQYQSLESCAKKVLAIADQTEDSTLFARAYNDLAIAYTCLKRYEDAIHYYKKALQLKLKVKDDRSLVILYHNIGDVYRTMKNPDKAIVYFKKSLTYTEKRGDALASGVMLRNIGEMYHQKQDYKNAGNFLKQSHQQLSKVGSLFEISRNHKLLATNYAALQDFKQAYYYHTLYKKIYDSIFNNEKSERIARLEQNFNDEKKQKAIALLKKESKLQQQKAGFQKKLRNAALAGLLLMIIILVLLYYHYKLRHKLLRQKSEVLAQENARHKAEGQRMEVEQKLKQEENKRLKLDLEYKNRELATSTLLVHNKNEVLTNIKSELNVFQGQVSPKWGNHLNKIQKIIKENSNLEEDWEQLKIHFNQVHPNFFHTLQYRFCNLSQNDLRLCAYIRINLTNKEIGRILNVEFRSVQVAKYRLKKKIGLTKEEDLSEFIQQV